MVFRTHVKAEVEVEDAVANVEFTGRPISPGDKELRLIMSHWFGWYPTSAAHRTDRWMPFLRRSYDQLTGLQSILDTLVWPEEFARYPPGNGVSRPWMFILATPTTSFVYDPEESIMFKICNELSDVDYGKNGGVKRSFGNRLEAR